MINTDRYTQSPKYFIAGASLQLKGIGKKVEPSKIVKAFLSGGRRAARWAESCSNTDPLSSLLCSARTSRQVCTIAGARLTNRFALSLLLMY